MSNIATKLTYLNGTKQAIKQAINEDFEVIDDNTTFREYAEEISSNNAKYKDLIPKETKNATNTLDISNSSGLDKALVTQYGNTKQSILPSEYTQVDYIRSTGGQYIDTGINADTNLRTILDIAFINPTSANQTMGAINIGTPNKRYHILSASNSISFWVNDANYGIINSASTDRHLWDLNVPEGKVVLDNTTTTTIPTNIDDVELNFWLFGRNSNATQYKAPFKLWACKMYYNETLVRDFIPCYRNSDNEIGLYDLVNNVFYTNQGTGAFTYGSIAPTPDTPQEIVNISGSTVINISDNNNHSKNYNIDLPVLCKIGNYKDRIYPLNGKWYLEKFSEKVTIDGTNIAVANRRETGTSGNHSFTFLFSKKAKRVDGTITQGGYCDKLVSKPRNNIYGRTQGFGYGVTNNDYWGDIVIFRTDWATKTVADVNTDLKSNPIELEYLLDSAETIEITESNYPTLYNQLNNIKLFEGVNHITMTNESGLDVEFDIEYYKDWKLD